MDSEKKSRANRENAKKSTGPRTTAGKSRASRNAMRHGLSSVAIADTSNTERITRIANKLCENDPFPYRYGVALEIADAQVMIDRIRLARAHLIATKKAPPKQTRSADMTAISEEEFQALVSALAKGPVRRIRQIIMAPSKRFAAYVHALARGESPTPPPIYGRNVRTPRDWPSWSRTAHFA